MKILSLILFAGMLIGSVRAEGRIDYSNCFIPGEISRYKIAWMGIPLAWSETSIDTITENGRKLIRIRMVSKNYKAYTHIYKVDNLTEVIIDPKTALPLRLDLQQNEGSGRKNQLTIFYHDKKTAVFHDRIYNYSKIVPINTNTQEVLSFIYSARNRNLDQLSKTTHTLFSEGKLYNLDIKLHATKKIKLPRYGKIVCTKVEPIAEFDGLFIRKGKITFWISEQQRKMITLIQARVPVGKISIKLQSVTGPGNDIWIRKK